MSTQGLGKDLKTHWLVDSGAPCHIVAGEVLVPTAGMVDLEFKVGKTPVVMQRVVVA